MHQTTVRFGTDLWHDLEAEAARLGVSVAQYVRDAALARLSYEAGRRDESGGEPARSGGEPARGEPGRGEASEMAPGGAPRGVAPVAPPAADADPVVAARERARAEVSSSEALWAQGRLVRRRAAEVRDDVNKLRSRIATTKR
jgi:hypothetical protein